MRWAAKRDDNERAIVKALEQAGCWVERISDKGKFDLLVCNPLGKLMLMEVKQPTGKLTVAQWETVTRIIASGVAVPVHIVTTPEGAVARAL